MEIKLNIYNELDEVVKTHRRNCYSLRMRQLKNIIETLDFEKLTDVMKGDTKEAVAVVGKFVLGSYEQVKNLLLDVFPDMTEDEYEETHVNEVAMVVINIMKYSFNVIALAGGQGKN